MDSTIAGVAVKKREPVITKIDGNPMSYFGCAKCKSTLRNIETFRRADGNVLQLLTCTECDYKERNLAPRNKPEQLTSNRYDLKLGCG